MYQLLTVSVRLYAVVLEIHFLPPELPKEWNTWIREQIMAKQLMSVSWLNKHDIQNSGPSYPLCVVLCACAQLCPTHGLYPGSSVHGVSQERILEQVAISSFRGSSRPRDWTHASCISCTGRRILSHSSPGKPHPLSGYLCPSAWIRVVSTVKSWFWVWLPCVNSKTCKI